MLFKNTVNMLFVIQKHCINGKHAHSHTKFETINSVCKYIKSNTNEGLPTCTINHVTESCDWAAILAHWHWFTLHGWNVTGWQALNVEETLYFKIAKKKYNLLSIKELRLEHASLIYLYSILGMLSPLTLLSIFILIPFKRMSSADDRAKISKCFFF